MLIVTLKRICPALLLAASLTAAGCNESTDGGAPPDGGTDGSPYTGETEIRHYTFRGLGGVSMGASGAIEIPLRHPEKFDLIASLGGYHDWTYMLHMVGKYMLGGFCSFEELMAVLQDDPEALNDPSHPGVYCGPVEAEDPFERTEDYNNWYFFDNGGKFDRDSFIDNFQDVAYAFGNPSSYNPDSPYLPAGVPAGWMAQDARERCEAEAVRVEDFHNAEYNPEGEYKAITYCDGEEPVEGGESNPDYWTLMGAYDPTEPHYIPFEVLLAVDYNDNGKRDYGEPPMHNPWERYEDAGTDGCPDRLEKGGGVCAASEADATFDASANPDPNVDDFHYLDNPKGTEGNYLWDEGEPFDDFGLDGVDGTGDYGEGNDRFDYSPNVDNYFDYDSYHNLLKLTPEQLHRLDIYIDGGRYDGFFSTANSNHFWSGLLAAGEDARLYDDFPSIVPDEQVKDMNDFLLSRYYLKAKYNEMGKHVMIRYGKADATVEEIRAGEGGHVGTAQQAVSRFFVAFSFFDRRWPGGDYRKAAMREISKLAFEATYRSDVLDSDREYSIMLPLGYNDPENAEERYPVAYILHGIGMEPQAMRESFLLFYPLQRDGNWQKMIFVFPDGRCCFRDTETGKRNCLATDENGEDLEDVEGWKRECNKGSFYVNGKGLDGANAKYEDSILELMDYIDGKYRTKPAEDVKVKKGGIPIK